MDEVVAVTVMRVLLFVLHVCMLRECEGARVTAMLVCGMDEVCGECRATIILFFVVRYGLDFYIVIKCLHHIHKDSHLPQIKQSQRSAEIACLPKIAWALSLSIPDRLYFFNVAVIMSMLK